MALSLYLLVILLSLVAIAINTSATVHLRLIHRHSIFPRYNDSKDESIQEPMFVAEDAILFLVNISIGEPPSSHLLAMDTGSNLVWVDCCFGAPYAFNPDRSITYAKIPSSSSQCSSFTPGTVQEGPDCRFSTEYEDGTSSYGSIARDTFNLHTSNGGLQKVPDVVFGCAANTSTKDSLLGGVLGVMARSPYHLVARLGNRFSYCIGDVWDLGYAHNRLVLGEGAVIQGDSTPMRMVDGYYSVTLEGISVGEKALSIKGDEFEFNVVVDSGSTVTELRESGYEALVAEVDGLIGGSLARFQDEEGSVCYMGEMERDLVGFPVVTLHLGEGAHIDMKVGALFEMRHGGVFCLAVVKAEGVNIIGVMAQQYYNVGFDFDQMRISFQKMNCELIEDE
ncbi:Eukaryotic aspartyl protease family protein [Striga hermonthica]|uniref:Eukaryotic aspartyl protease family protein n=1 Tax=Striga hermonthica TaxID=68872 RepID=A0A9N7R594_STRHE|nr:Eukaryotic aspartyl protease family protein [Striga hermonthica]